MSFSWETTVISIISFSILYFLLNKYAFGPLFSIMEKRRELVVNELKNAENNRAESEKLIAEQKEAIQNARKEAFEIIEQARKTSTKQAEQILASANEEAQRNKEMALRDIESEKSKAIAALRQEVSAMSVLIASKIIEKEINEQAQEELVNKYLQDVGGIQ